MQIIRAYNVPALEGILAFETPVGTDILKVMQQGDDLVFYGTADDVLPEELELEARQFVALRTNAVLDYADMGLAEDCEKRYVDTITFLHTTNRGLTNTGYVLHIWEIAPPLTQGRTAIIYLSKAHAESLEARDVADVADLRGDA